MNVVGILMAKDEEDIIEYTIRHFFGEGLDNILVADNMSTDNTRDVLSKLQSEFSQLTVIEDDRVEYYQSEKMTKLAHRAAETFKADWIVPFDADELWYSTTGTDLASMLRDSWADVIEAPVFDHIPQISDSRTGNPYIDIVNREPQRERWPCVAFRYEPTIVIHQGNHGVTHSGTWVSGQMEIRHFQYRRFDQFMHKLRNGKKAYDATDLPFTYGQHWREWGALDDEALLKEWKGLVNQTGLVYDPAPYKGN